MSNKLPPHLANLPFVPLKRASVDDILRKRREGNQQESTPSNTDSSSFQHNGEGGSGPELANDHDHAAQSHLPSYRSAPRPQTYPDPYILLQASHLSQQSTQLSKLVVSAMEDIQARQKQLDDMLKGTATRLDKLEKGLGTLITKIGKVIPTKETYKNNGRVADGVISSGVMTRMEGMDGRLGNCEILMKTMMRKLEEISEKSMVTQAPYRVELSGTMPAAEVSRTVQTSTPNMAPKTPAVSRKRKIMDEEDMKATDDDEWLEGWFVESDGDAQAFQEANFIETGQTSERNIKEQNLLDTPQKTSPHKAAIGEATELQTRTDETPNPQDSAMPKGPKRRLVSTQEMHGEGEQGDDDFWEGY